MWLNRNNDLHRKGFIWHNKTGTHFPAVRYEDICLPRRRIKGTTLCGNKLSWQPWLTQTRKRINALCGVCFASTCTYIHFNEVSIPFLTFLMVEGYKKHEKHDNWQEINSQIKRMSRSITIKDETKSNSARQLRGRLWKTCSPDGDGTSQVIHLCVMRDALRYTWKYFSVGQDISHSQRRECVGWKDLTFLRTEENKLVKAQGQEIEGKETNRNRMFP